MSEKTSEEKLREELEGNPLTEDNYHSSSPEESRARRGVRHKVSSGTGKSIGQRVDSFIDEFEKKIEESINIGSVKVQPAQEKPRVIRRTESDKPEAKESTVKPKAPVNIPKPDSQRKMKPEEPSQPEVISVHDEHEETKQPLTVDVHDEIATVEAKHEDGHENTIQAMYDPETEHEENMHIETVNDIPQFVPESELEASQIEPVNELPQVIPEAEHEPSQIEPVNDIPQFIPESEPEPEPVIDDVDDVPEESESLSVIEPEPEHTARDELPDIPLIDSDEQEDELPDIPVISADDVEEPDGEELEEFDDIPVIDVEPESEPKETEDEMLEVTADNEEPAPELEPDYDVPDAITKDEEHENISSPADIVVNVDEDLPQIIDEPEHEEDPEAEAAPVSVTMPESTKTAEDKLMADIAEAMTGNPLTLDSKESPEPYRLPEDFFTSQNTNSDTEQQSAEDKLKANIAQAMSESPLGIAQQQAMQKIEDDLNPFDDIPLPDLSHGNSTVIPEEDSEPDSDSESEPEHNEETNEAFLPDFTDEPENITADPEEIHDISEPEPEENEANEAEDNDDDSDPFDIDDEDNELEHEQPEEHEENETNLDDLHLINTSDDIPDDEPMIESDTELEVEDVPVPDAEPEQESEPESESEHMTAQQRLEKEIAYFTQNTSDDTNNDNNDNEEAEQEKKMPESLLDENEHQEDDDEIGDDWDINSLGIVSEAASIPDDEPEPELEPSLITGITEETHKEKTMGLREKLAAKKNGTEPKDSSSPASKKNSSSSSSGSSGGGILLPSLLLLLLIVGALTLWQLYSLPDRLASVIAMNSGGGNFESVSGVETNPSYDYSIDFILDQNIPERMSQRGREGWQVVGSRRTQDSTTGQYGYEIIFMRRISGR